MTHTLVSTLLQAPVLQCPTCKLRFHEQRHCRRCGTDLSLLMNTALCANRLRDQARASLLQGHYQQALEYGKKAQRFHKTSMGSFLIVLAKKAMNQDETK